LADEMKHIWVFAFGNPQEALSAKHIVRKPLQKMLKLVGGKGLFGFE